MNQKKLQKPTAKELKTNIEIKRSRNQIQEYGRSGPET